jgi:hypothetical protein
VKRFSDKTHDETKAYSIALKFGIRRHCERSEAIHRWFQSFLDRHSGQGRLAMTIQAPMF